MSGGSLEAVQALQVMVLVEFLLAGACLACGQKGVKLEVRDDGRGRFRCSERKCRQSAALREGSVFDGCRVIWHNFGKPAIWKRTKHTKSHWKNPSRMQHSSVIKGSASFSMFLRH